MNALKNQHQEELTVKDLKATHTAARGCILHNFVDVDSFQGSLSSTMRHYTGNPSLLSDLPHCH